MLIKKIKEYILQCLKDSGYDIDNIELVRTKENRFGHFTTNIALKPRVDTTKTK